MFSRYRIVKHNSHSRDRLLVVVIVVVFLHLQKTKRCLLPKFHAAPFLSRSFQLCTVAPELTR
jgi:hypothetical protein